MQGILHRGSSIRKGVSNEVGGNLRREKTRTSKRFRRSRGGGVSMVSPEQQQLVEAMLSAQHNALVKDAQRFECKVLLAQPLVHAYLVKQWRGNAFQAALEGLEELTAVDGAWLLVQLLALPLVLPLVALYPALTDHFSWMSLDRGVGSPLVRFSLAFIVDVALAVMATLLAAEPGGQLERNVFFSPCLVVLAGVSWSEAQQLMRGGVMERTSARGGGPSAPAQRRPLGGAGRAPGVRRRG